MRGSTNGAPLKLAGAVLAGMMAASMPALGATPGSLFILAEPVEPSSGFEKEVKSKARQVVEMKNDQWTLYFVAFLKKPPGVPDVELVFYDVADKAHEPTNHFAITTQPSAKILASNISFGIDQGFKAGHKYNVLITRLVGGKEDVYAKGQVTLK